MNQATHTGGHMDEAYRQEMRPAYVDWEQGVEVVPRWVDNPQNDQQKRAASIWHSSGFTGQKDASNRLEGESIKPTFDAMQGLSKLAYLSGIMPSETQGDPENIKRTSGNNFADILIGLSALSDFFQASNPDSGFSLDYIAPQGAPGLKANWKF